MKICFSVNMQILGILSGLRHFFPRNILKTIYFSFVNQYFLYCVSVWASAFHLTFKPLQTLQDKALRLMLIIDHQLVIFMDLLVSSLFIIIILLSFVIFATNMFLDNFH